MAQEPLYVVRDGALKTESAAMSREAAGRLATEQTLEAGRKGEAVAVGELDRFTVARAPQDRPAPVTPPRTFTALEAEAALCLWEAMLDARLESSLPDLSNAFDSAGSYTMRQHALGLAPFVLAVHAALPDNVREGAVPYDFGVVPAVLAVIHWSGAGYVLPSVPHAAEKVANALRAEGWVS